MTITKNFNDMEITVKVNVMLDASPALLGAIGGILNPIQGTTLETKREPEPAKQSADTARETLSVRETLTVPELKIIEEPEPQPQPQPEPVKQPQPEYREKPEDVLPLLRERFGIPAGKEDRTPDEQERARGLNKAVIAVIRDVTKNSGARSIADLRTEDDRQEFIRQALLISYDVNTQAFTVNPF